MLLEPVQALTAWLDALPETQRGPLAPLFVSIARNRRLGTRLSDRSVALIIKRWACAAKLNPALFAGHSLRAGFVTAALEAGADPIRLMELSRHRRIYGLRACAAH